MARLPGRNEGQGVGAGPGGSTSACPALAVESARAEERAWPLPLCFPCCHTVPCQPAGPPWAQTPVAWASPFRMLRPAATTPRMVGRGSSRVELFATDAPEALPAHHAAATCTMCLAGLRTSSAPRLLLEMQSCDAQKHAECRQLVSRMPSSHPPCLPPQTTPSCCSTTTALVGRAGGQVVEQCREARDRLAHCFFCCRCCLLARYRACCTIGAAVALCSVHVNRVPSA